MRARLFAVLAGAVLFAQGSQAFGNDTRKTPVRFGSLENPSTEVVRARAEAWLKEAVKGDAAKMQQFQTIWKNADRTVLERVSDTLALGNADAAKLIADARNPLVIPPQQVPAVFKDTKQAEFLRANLGLAYARSMSNRRGHEIALDVLKSFKAEQVVDPAAFLFHKAVCEHALTQKDEANKTIARLIYDAVDSPERYKTVGALMMLDMQTWKAKDLAAVGRIMDNIERRLDLVHGGPVTRELQKQAVLRLDELIKELENKAKQQQQSSGGQPKPGDGSCPPTPGSQPGNQPGAGNQPNQPMPDSRIANNGGSGRVDPARIRKLAEGWGRMSPQQRAQAMQELEDLTRGLSLAHQEAFREYFRRIAEASQKSASR
jgi:hypothetical protein